MNSTRECFNEKCIEEEKKKAKKEEKKRKIIYKMGSVCCLIVLPVSIVGAYIFLID